MEDGKKKIKAIAQKRGHSIISISNSKDPLTDLDITKCDVVIDFSTPDTAFDNISYSLINNTPYRFWNYKLVIKY